MTVRVTTLVDNTVATRGLLAEHGLSLWIDTGECCVLFDTGQGLTLTHNAAALGVDLNEAHAVLLSHGHYDHTGGLHHLLSARPGLDVFLHPAALGVKFSTRGGGAPRDIGIPQVDREALSERAKLRWTVGPTRIGEHLTLTGPIPRVVAFEDAEGDFFKDANACTADPLVDDQAAFVETEKGIIVFLGCAHAGVVNTLRYVADITGGRPIHAVVGGMHLASASRPQVEAAIQSIVEMGVSRVVPAHCTGLVAAALLQERFGVGCSPVRVGVTLDFE